MYTSVGMGEGGEGKCIFMWMPRMRQVLQGLLLPCFAYDLSLSCWLFWKLPYQEQLQLTSTSSSLVCNWIYFMFVKIVKISYEIERKSRFSSPIIPHFFFFTQYNNLIHWNKLWACKLVFSSRQLILSYGTLKYVTKGNYWRPRE